MNEAIDLSALNWVQRELGETLKQGRLFLEEYAEGSRDTGTLSNCMACLHEARGPLRIVELNGADLLASEMEEVLNDLLNERIDNADAAMQVLMQSFIQLPDYLLALRGSRYESGDVLLPVINELRAIRGVDAIPEGEAFSFDLHVDLPVTAYDPQQAAAFPETTQLARTLRQRFQAGLLEWYRDVDNNAGLQAISEVVDSLRQASRQQEAARLWWLAGGFTEVLLADPHAATTESKQLMGQLDRQIKCLIDAGDAGFAAQVPDALLEILLKYITASDVEGGQAGEIRRVYATAERPAGAGLDGRNLDVLNTVMTAALQDLGKIKEQLERFSHSESGAGDLNPVIDDLHALANTLEISGIDAAARIIENVILRCHEIKPGTAADTDAVLERIAGSLVSVETSIRDMCARELTQESGDSTASLAWNEGLAAVIKEVVADMTAAKEHIDSYLQDPETSSALENVPGLLLQIRGGLQLADQDRAAALVGRVNDYLDTALLRSEQLPDAEQLDMLADAICSIEYFVEELGEQRIHGGMVLDIAEQSLDKLGAGALAADAPAETGIVKQPVTVEEPGAALEDMVTTEESAPDDAGFEATDQQSVAVVQPVDTPVISELQVLPDDPDMEILEIFIEEVEGELERLSRLIPGWVADTENREMIETICRSFHTLKGGGRMVGALALAEFSWAFEHLLNQVVEGNLAASAEFFHLVLEASESLGQLLEQVKSGTPPEADVDALVARATAMLMPASPAGSDDQPGLVNAPSVLADSAVAAVNAGRTDEPDAGIPAFETPESAGEAAQPINALPVLVADADPEIVEIFMEEAEEVLEEIAAQLPAWLDNTENSEALETLRRCFHTLKGSGRMAGAMLVGEFSWTIENLLNRVVEGAMSADAVLVAVVERVPVPLSELIAQVNGGPQPETDYRELMRAAEQLARGEQPDMAGVADDAPTVADTEEITRVEPDIGEPADAEPDADDEADIIDIFRRESVGHLAAIQAYIEEFHAGKTEYRVSEPLYRALHTLSSITESAGLPTMHRLAMALYGYFDELNEQQLQVSDAALGALDNCRMELTGMVERLPIQDFDIDRLNSLLAEIDSLPVEVPAAGDDVQDTPTAGEETETAQDAPVMDDNEPAPAGDTGVAEDAATDMTDVQETPAVEPPLPTGDFAGMDPELLEVFIEEASDIIDSSETTLRAWKDDHANRELLDEFQRQLHTLKGGARMIELGAIGDLSHGVETLLTRVVDGQVAVSDALFDSLQQAHDTLAVMLDKVRANEMPASAPQLEQWLGQLAHEPVTAEADESHEASTADTAETGETDTEAEAAGQQEPASWTTSVTSFLPAWTASWLGTGARKDTEAKAGQATGSLADIAPDKPAEEPPAGTAVSQPPPADVSAHQDRSRAVERRKPTRARAEQVRIQADLLDNLVNHVGEINIYRSRLEQQFGLYRFNIDELEHTVRRLRDQMRQLEIETETQILYRHEQEAGAAHAGFDPLEMDRYSNLQQLSRSLMESIGDLDSIRELMDGTTRESETLLLQQSRVTTDLQDGLLRTRMIPFASLAPRLRRIVRQAASELGKRVELRLEGADGEMDRTVVERIIAPLEHMLRNAVDHGIEKPADRKQAGKPRSGSIQVSFHREGPEIVLRIADDGNGIDLQALRAKAIERDLMSDDAALSDDDVMQFILQSGFSTAREVTQISGRGVGMDVVNSEVRQLGGSLHIASEAGKGSTFTVRLPYTLAINQALLVRAGEENFCIPLASIEGVVRVEQGQLAACYAEQDPVYDYAGKRYQLRHLGSLLGAGGVITDNADARLPVLLIRTGEKRVALQVEALHGNREIVVKPLGVQLSNVNGISGATILGDGRVVLILDLAAVVRMEGRQPVAADAAAPVRNNKLTVMVVDDSITVRKVTTRLLQQHGFEVITAKDGVDAMGQLQECVPDMMLLDIEMPRMDGFELATLMRNDERFRHIPITIVTSRTGDKHRERAREIGIDQYLGKPYQEHELLHTVHRLIGISSDEPAGYQEQADG